jgi:hypothetical protein
MVATLAQTIHLHRPRGAEFLSPTATKQGTSAMIQPERSPFPRMGMPRRVLVKGMQGADVTVVVTVAQGTVWLSISPPFTWEAIMTPSKVDEVIHALELAREEAKEIAAARNGNALRAGNVEAYSQASL